MTTEPTTSPTPRAGSGGPSTPPLPPHIHASRKITPDELRGRRLIPAELRGRGDELRDPEVRRGQRYLAPHWLKLAQSDFILEPSVPRKTAQEIALHAYYTDATPLKTLDIQGWVDVFARVGLLDGVGKRLGPGGKSETLRLYRGSEKHRPHGLSWTPFFDMATHFAIQRPRSAVFQMDVMRSEVIHFNYFDGHLIEVIADSRPHDVRLAVDLNQQRK